jgi:hypothetical protein
MGWNILGALSALNLSESIIRLFDGTDILTFSHTGHKPTDPIPEIPGFRPVVCTSRPHDSKSGGVAIYISKNLPSNAAVLLHDLPEFGMAWIRINLSRRSIFLCSSYIPPQNSSYFYNEDGNLDAEAHFNTLNLYIAKFTAVGEVIIIGDLNARTGVDDDRMSDSDLAGWQDMNAANLPVPSDLNILLAAKSIPPR